MKLARGVLSVWEVSALCIRVYDLDSCRPVRRGRSIQ
jgi:hypothetical protein